MATRSLLRQAYRKCQLRKSTLQLSLPLWRPHMLVSNDGVSSLLSQRSFLHAVLRFPSGPAACGRLVMRGPRGIASAWTGLALAPLGLGLSSLRADPSSMAAMRTILVTVLTRTGGCSAVVATMPKHKHALLLFGSGGKAWLDLAWPGLVVPGLAWLDLVPFWPGFPWISLAWTGSPPPLPRACTQSREMEGTQCCAHWYQYTLLATSMAPQRNGARPSLGWARSVATLAALCLATGALARPVLWGRGTGAVLRVPPVLCPRLARNLSLETTVTRWGFGSSHH